ncbi:MAG: DMT family transporter [Ginsengibacter sp.]|jgi:drug/metabolite transporter (DMT)-like permease
MDIFSNKWIILTVLALTWGSSFILIKKSLVGFTPLQIGSIRVIVSGLLFMVIGFRAMRKMDKKTFWWMVLAGTIGNFIPMFLFPLAQTRVSSSMAGILDSLVPVFVLVLGFIFFKIRSKTVQWAGALIGFVGAGTLLYFSGTSSGDSEPAYAMLIVLATACYAGAALIINQKLTHVHAVELSASVFTVWMFPSIIIFMFSGIFHDFQNTSLQWESSGHLAILSVVGTALAMLLYFRLIQTTSAVFASMVTYLLPLVAVFWGLLAGESFNIWYALGGLLIILGIYLVQEKNAPRLGENLSEVSEKTD